MPKGAPAKREAKGYWARYRQKYMHGDEVSFAPVVHLYIAMVLFGYTYQVLSPTYAPVLTISINHI